MPTNLYGIVRVLNRAIRDGRTLRAIHAHGVGEMNELEQEIEKVEQGLPAGPDGVIGEAMDVILCKLDVIFEADPDITDEELDDIAERKGMKWMKGALAKMAAAEDASHVGPA